MRIIIDAMGGDNAPGEIIKGAIAGYLEFNVDITLVGDSEQIKRICEEENFPVENFTIVHAEQFITMEDPALSVVRDKNESSMTLGLKELVEGRGDAFVSAGNTGALLAGATFIVRRIKGLRAAIATVLPLEKPTLLIDSGANVTVTEENLEQFAIMGSIYMQNLFGIDSPRVGLLNNGSERTKGTPLQLAAYERLEKSDVNFVGNIEGKDVPFGKVDVIVTDGFTGNILLKTIEGLGSFFMKRMKNLFLQNPLTKVTAILIKNNLKQLKKEFDASEYGGAPLLGISKPVIKAHGSSDAKAIKNAIRQAVVFVNTNVTLDIAKKTSQYIIKKKSEMVNDAKNNTVPEVTITCENE